jgi:hypothetical protein
VGKFLQGVSEELTLYVRQSAWLNAPLERPKNDKGEEPQRSRLQILRRDLQDESHAPEMPPVDAGAHLLGYLFEIGPTMPAGMGPGAISNTELRAWQDNTGIELSAWEARTIRALSRAYVSEYGEAGDPKRQAPWNAADDAEQRQRIAQNTAASMRASIRRMAA